MYSALLIGSNHSLGPDILPVITQNIYKGTLEKFENLPNNYLRSAKGRIFDRNKTVSQIAYELGFKYPQHFSRLFKQRVGQPPNEYRLN